MIGARVWAIPGGLIPVESRGEEPRFTSRDEVSILNAGAADATIEITAHHPDRAPVGPYAIAIAALRLRRFRVNDLIFPEALELGVPYALVLRSNVPVVVQFARFDSAALQRTMFSALAAGPSG